MNLEYLSKILGVSYKGNPNFQIRSICSHKEPKKDSVFCLMDIKYLSNSLIENTGVFLIDKSSMSLFSDDINLLITNDIKSSFIKLTEIFRPKISVPKKFKSPENLTNFSSTGSFYTGSNVLIGVDCIIGNNVVLEDSVIIGNNVKIGNNVTIGFNCIIGDNVTIGNCSSIGSEGFGNIKTSNHLWLHISHLGNVIIGNNVSIGSNCNIDRGTIDATIIEENVILDNHIHIAHNVLIGEKTAIAANTAIAGSSIIGKRNMIGGMVGIVDHIKIADDVIISATSTVFTDINEPGVYTGIMPIFRHAKWKRIAVWISKLDKIVNLLNFRKKNYGNNEYQ